MYTTPPPLVCNAAHVVHSLGPALRTRLSVDTRNPGDARIIAADDMGHVEVILNRELARDAGSYLVEWSGDNPTLHAENEWPSVGGRHHADPSTLAIRVEDGEITLTLDDGGCGIELDAVGAWIVRDLGIRLLAFAGPTLPVGGE